ncbi:hypothetical protein GCM10008969_05310 [Pseudomonas veronii subsp. inensis]|uniref:hypothetical protein n=1 Tax=Pseudomonas veronii TaxID=76761 RepID=UPI0031F82FA3
MPFSPASFNRYEHANLRKRPSNPGQMELELRQAPDPSQLMLEARTRADSIAVKRRLLGQRWWNWAQLQIQVLPEDEQVMVRCALSFTTKQLLH